jgi:RHS repeat-associated protein
VCQITGESVSVYGPRGIQAVEDSVGVWSHPVQDGLGSVRDDALGYSPFGVPDASVSGFAFTGEMRDGNGLQYHRARYYSPELGVWPSLDPLELSNRYAYVNGNPVKLVDPFGLSSLDGSWKDVGGGGGDLGVILLAWLTSIVAMWPEGNVGFQWLQIELPLSDLPGPTSPLDLVPSQFLDASLPASMQIQGYVNVECGRWPAGNLRTNCEADLYASLNIPYTRTGDAVLPDFGGLPGEEGETGPMVPGPLLPPDLSDIPWDELADQCGDALERLIDRIIQRVRPLDRTGDCGDDCDDDQTYYFRGTTVGYPGNPVLQRLGLTPTSTQPAVATVFATVAETEYGGNGVVYIVSSNDLASVLTSPGNDYAYEFEAVFEILPLDFARTASTSVSATGARSILASMGVSIDSRISLSEQTSYLESITPMSLSKPEIKQFVNLARTTP